MHSVLKRAAMASLLDVIILILCVFLFSLLYVRFDATAGKRMALAPVSQELLLQLNDTLKIAYYVSPELEIYSGGVFQIDAKLQEFAAAGHFISYVKSDPAASGSGKNVESYGILPRQINTVRDNKTVITTVYSGILLEYNGLTEVIPVIYESDNLEYMISSCISRLIYPRVRTAAIFASGTEAEKGRLYAAVPQWLESLGISTVFVDSITDSYAHDIVIVFGDAAVTAEDVEFLCRYTEQGGAALICVSPSTLSLYSDWICAPILDFQLEPLLRSFGISVVPEMIQDTSNVVMQLRSPDNSQVDQVAYPFWVQILPSGVNKDHPVTASVNALTCFWPGYLLFDSKTRGDGLEITPLVFSSAYSHAVPAPFDTNPYGTLPLSLEAPQQQYCLAAAAEHKGGRISGRLVVIADSLFVSDVVNISGSVFNFDFFSNAVEWLCGNEQLLQLKSSGAGIRRLEFDTDNPHDLRAAHYAILFCCGGIPLICLAGCGFVYRKRRKSI